jgi:hypothetical protein
LLDLSSTQFSNPAVVVKGSFGHYLSDKNKIISRDPLMKWLKDNEGFLVEGLVDNTSCYDQWGTNVGELTGYNFDETYPTHSFNSPVFSYRRKVKVTYFRSLDP